MEIRALAVPDAWSLHPRTFADDRGVFLEWYRREKLAEVVGHPLALAQANCSVSRAGVIRGIHYADVPPSQAKYITCVSGALLDVIVDIRVGSPAFGQWDSVLLDSDEPAAVYLSEGLGHAFCALTDNTTAMYLCSEVYNPTAEHEVNPLDPALALPWPDEEDLTLTVSAKDGAAPALAEAEAAGLLPRFDDCRRLYRRLDASA